MGLIDAIDIQDSLGRTVASLARRIGPIEPMILDSLGIEHAYPVPYPLFQTENFGIDATGNAYYDTNGPTAGEEAILWLIDYTPTFEVRSGADR